MFVMRPSKRRTPIFKHSKSIISHYSFGRNTGNEESGVCDEDYSLPPIPEKSYNLRIKDTKLVCLEDKVMVDINKAITPSRFLKVFKLYKQFILLFS